jgi:hypothetical protein
MLGVVILGVVILSVIMLGVVAPSPLSPATFLSNFYSHHKFLKGFKTFTLKTSKLLIRSPSPPASKAVDISD